MRRHLAGAIPVAMKGMSPVRPDRPTAQSGWRVEPIDTESEPSELRRREIRYLAFCRFLPLRERDGAACKNREACTESRDRGAAHQSVCGFRHRKCPVLRRRFKATNLMPPTPFRHA